MSHKATNWAVQQRGISPAAKVVLWHLCDRHHPDHGCFPSQRKLEEDSEVSRATINRVLNDLEKRGLLRRVSERDELGRQMSTRYYFAFEDDFYADRVSECDAEPCRISSETRVADCDTNPVREITSNNKTSGDDLFGESAPVLSKEKTKTEREQIDEDFEAAWKEYPHNPNRRDRRGALIKWRVLCEGKDDYFPKQSSAELLRGVQAYASTKPDSQYVPAMRRWLNEGRWEVVSAEQGAKKAESKWARETRRMEAAERRALR